MAPSQKTEPPIPERADELAALLHELRLHDDASELRHLAELCRRSPRVHTWLFGRFGTEPETREKFRAFLRNPAAVPDGLWSPILEQEIASKPPLVAVNDGPHGGLAELAVWALLERYQAGRMNVMTFFLVRFWLRVAAENTAPPPALWSATLAHWAAIVDNADGRLARDLLHAIAFFHQRPGAKPGAARDSWKIHVLLYILDHPQPCYRVGELLAALPERFQRIRRNGNPYVDRREIRRFCEDHRIQRDRRSGPPRRSAS